MSIRELDALIEEKALSAFEKGKRKAIEGTNFEKRVVFILNHPSNKEKWNLSSSTQDGFRYPYFKQILYTIGIDSSERIIQIKATDKIPNLPSRGKPKTDIALTITTDKRSNEQFIFSCKKSSANVVSIHQYALPKFIKVRGITDKTLIQALSEFQNLGGYKALQKQFPNLYEYLLQQVPVYNLALAKWAYGGSRKRLL